mmetsp:Transcript_16366/g.33344  ORF Transcript_16366/g.33344 Transcript_16366/m.33344 type:complete len:189 (-) Transcript_16366:959-1525(-)
MVESATAKLLRVDVCSPLEMAPILTATLWEDCLVKHCNSSHTSHTLTIALMSTLPLSFSLSTALGLGILPHWLGPQGCSSQIRLLPSQATTTDKLEMCSFSVIMKTTYSSHFPRVEEKTIQSDSVDVDLTDTSQGRVNALHCSARSLRFLFMVFSADVRPINSIPSQSNPRPIRILGAQSLHVKLTWT